MIQWRANKKTKADSKANADRNAMTLQDTKGSQGLALRGIYQVGECGRTDNVVLVSRIAVLRVR